MDAVRDIALLILIIEALVLGLAVFAAGIMAAVAIIEVTVGVRRGLRRGGRVVEQVHAQVVRVTAEHVVGPATGLQRRHASLEAFLNRIAGEFEQARSGRRDARGE